MTNQLQRSLTRANVDQVKAMAREELVTIAREMGIEPPMATVAMVEITSELAEHGRLSTGNVPRRGTMKMIGLLAFIGMATIVDEEQEVDGDT